MDTWTVAALAFVAGGLITALLAWTRYAARLASVETERDLLRDRVDDLESSLAEDLETAALIAPLKESLTRVERQVGVMERDRVEQFGSIRTVLARVEGETAELGHATASLAGSLRSSTVRGSWGEVQLRRVLEVSGMLARCDFDEQLSGRTALGAAVRPDVVVRLPGERSVVIDAKAPMDAFLAAQAEGLGEDEVAALMREHAGQLRGHVQRLAAKEYWSAFARSPEMVVCFVPSDAMLATALSAQPELHEWAMERRVALVGPAALLALLRTVAFTWQQSALVEHAEQIALVGRELYARLATLGTHTAKMGRSLTASVEAYNALVGSLESRVLVTARSMQAMGVSSEPLSQVPAVETSPRPLTALELIEHATAEDARPELPLQLTGRTTPPESRGADAS